MSIFIYRLQEVDAKPQSLLIEYIKENSWVKLLQAYLGAYGLVKVDSLLQHLSAKTRTMTIYYCFLHFCCNWIIDSYFFFAVAIH